ncbi:MAG: response regulator [Candidatus Chaera renei]|uniref:Response regulator n=1 Tax=Candidatus Chaera renei TaxID=2506947 RepID=A0A4V1J7L3_9BACT|nr:MAG: response regulator [Candidatus Chaera renei]
MPNNPIKTILCIEDDRFIGEMYSRSLSRAGYQVDWIISGAEGLQAALSKNYDLILLDVMLPERQGTEILQDLRGSGDKVPHSRILVLTNYDQDEESRLAMQSQADGYLIKADITPRKLLEIISQMQAAA